MPAGKKISRLITWIVLAITSTCVVVVPLGFFYLSYRYIDGGLENDAKINARIITELINSNPELWEFEHIRLTEILSRRTNTVYAETRRILNAKGEIVAEVAAHIDTPVIRRSFDLLDSGIVVGRIEIRRSLRPLLMRTLVVASVSLPIGVLAFLFIRVFPIRALERKEAALRQSERKYRDLFEHAYDAVFLTGPEYAITDANNAAAGMFGYSAEEMRHMKLFDLVTPEKIFGPEVFSERRETGHAGAKYLARARTKYGKVLDVEVSSSLIISDENVRGSRNIVRDLTERRQMEKELRRAQNLESIGVLAGGIAHDFNNLLTAILGNISMLKLSIGPRDEAYERLIDAENASRRAKDLTHQLLTFSKGGTPVKKPSSIVRIIRDSAGFVLSGSNVRYELHMDDTIWPVDVDVGQMSQVMNNLLINADQAMPDGGTIRIVAENIVICRDYLPPMPQGKYVKITIEDQGIGISQDHLQKIFDPYFTTKQKGSGLGLSITFSIIRKHDGYITVKSEQGKGTTFTIFLPASERQPVYEPTQEKTPAANPLKILLMDDEEILRHVAGAMLRSEGHEVNYAANGSEAIELYKTAVESGRPFDLVIIDLTIPGGMGGKETIKKLLEINPEVKAIVSSGYATDPVMSDFRSYGFTDCLVKPYTVEDLNHTLFRALKNRPQSSD